MKLLVALPCYNEAEKIQKVIQEIPSSFEGIDERRILVVDDGSADETASLAHEAGAFATRSTRGWVRLSGTRWNTPWFTVLTSWSTWTATDSSTARTLPT